METSRPRLPLSMASSHWPVKWACSCSLLLLAERVSARAAYELICSPLFKSCPALPACLPVRQLVRFGHDHVVFPCMDSSILFFLRLSTPSVARTPFCFPFPTLHHSAPRSPKEQCVRVCVLCGVGCG